jgi:hypothetical protein
MKKKQNHIWVYEFTTKEGLLFLFLNFFLGFGGDLAYI